MSENKKIQNSVEKVADERLEDISGGIQVWLADRSAGVVTCPECGGTEITKGDDGMYLCSCGVKFTLATESMKVPGDNGRIR